MCSTMSLFLTRIAKLSLRQNAGVRLFSSTPSRIPPRLLLGCHVVGYTSGGDEVRNVKLLDAVKEDTVTITDKIFPKALSKTRVMGSSNGWAAFLDDRDGTVRLSDVFNPWASKTSPKVISLPPIVALPFSQTRVATNVAMSSSPEQEGCVVAVKFLGNQLSLCRPGQDSEWTTIRTPTFFNTSKVIYSKREGMFHMHTDGCHYTAAFNLNKNLNHPKLRSLHFGNLPEMLPSDWEVLNSWFRSEYLVESPSGELLVVKWFGRSCQKGSDREVELIYQETGLFMVFREREENKGTASYTRDIGDLCIFLGMNESFCVGASTCPGLKANSIYFISNNGLGVYDLATDMVRHFDPSGVPTRVLSAPIWLPPSGHTSSHAV